MFPQADMDAVAMSVHVRRLRNQTEWGELFFSIKQEDRQLLKDGSDCQKFRT